MKFKMWLENKEEKLLYIMRGVPGSGKSYTAKMLAGNSGVIYSTDEFWGEGEEYRQNFSKAIKDGSVGRKLGQYHKQNFDRTEMALKQGVSPVIVDNTNVDARAIKPYVTIGKKYNYKVEFKEPTSEWWSKISPLLHDKQTNDSGLRDAAKMLANRNEHGVPEDVIYKMLRKWIIAKESDF